MILSFQKNNNVIITVTYICTPENNKIIINGFPRSTNFNSLFFEIETEGVSISSYSIEFNDENSNCVDLLLENPQNVKEVVLKIVYEVGKI